MSFLRPNAQRARYAIALIWAVMVMDIISFASSYFQFRLLDAIQAGANISDETIDANDSREALIGLLYLVVYITSAITFIQWFRRAYYNLHQHVSTLAHPESWAAIGWFVPILCLFRPYQIMRELFRETRALLGRREVVFQDPQRSALTGWWWALWVLSSILGQLSFRVSMHAESIEGVRFATEVDMISSAVGVPLALLAVLVVKDYAAMERLLPPTTSPDAAVQNAS